MASNVFSLFWLCQNHVYFQTKYKHEKLAIGTNTLINTQNVAISHCCFAENSEQIHKLLLSYLLKFYINYSIEFVGFIPQSLVVVIVLHSAEF